jgi:signal transduction histidine kinase
MTIEKPQVPLNEMERLLSLSGFDVDYSEHKKSFNDLAKLAAAITGTQISLVNLIDSYTQWTISNHGMDLDQMLREDSACQYTIMSNEHFEVGDMSADARFKDKFYVTGEPLARYYLGVPLTVGNGVNIGALCVLDRESKVLTADQVTMLKIIADEIVSRLKTFQVLESLKVRIRESERSKMKVAHDIRGPLAGIVGLTEIITDQGEANAMSEVLEYVSIIRDSSHSLLDLTGEIMKVSGSAVKFEAGSSFFNLSVLKTKLQNLYTPQALQKHISLTINTSAETDGIVIAGNKLLQIIGNLVCNSLKFTPSNGKIEVSLLLSGLTTKRTLEIAVTDTGTGISETGISSILSGTSASMNGTIGEEGFGFGLALVKQLTEMLGGTIRIESVLGEGSRFEIILPQPAV